MLRAYVIESNNPVINAESMTIEAQKSREKENQAEWFKLCREHHAPNMNQDR